MSSEQARGDRDQMGPPSDIFGLGAILYSLLTGRAPYEGGGGEVAVRRAARAEFPPPRSVNPAVSPALESVCLKAMAAEPGDRYPSALALAGDVERWLADEPVTAATDPVAVRTRRWMRKHPRMVAAVVTTLVIGMAAAGVVAWQRDRALAVTREQKRRTREALDTMVSREMIQRLGMQKEMTVGQREFLLKAVGYYRDFANEAATDNEGRRLVADAHYRIAQLLTALGAYADAEAAFRSGLAEYQRLSPSPEQRRVLARCGVDFGILLIMIKKFNEAESEYHAARATQEALAAEDPQSPGIRHEFARTHLLLMNLFGGTGRPERAEPAGQAALVLLKRLAAEDPSSAISYRHELAQTLNSLGLMRLRSRETTAEAEVSLRAALDHCEWLVRAVPDEAEYRDQLAQTQKNLGLALEMKDDRHEAESAYRAAVARSDENVDRFPALSKYAIRSGSCLIALGNLLLDSGEVSKAAELHGRAIARLTPVVKAEPRHAVARQELCDAYQARAEGYVKLQQYPDALADLDRAAEVADGDKPDHVRIGRAYCLAHTGDTAQAVALADQVLAKPTIFPGLTLKAARVYAASAATTHSEETAHKTVAALRRAFEDGAPIPLLMAIPEIAPLRDRDDFKKLVAEMEAKAAAAKSAEKAAPPKPNGKPAP